MFFPVVIQITTGTMHLFYIYIYIIGSGLNLNNQLQYMKNVTGLFIFIQYLKLFYLMLPMLGKEIIYCKPHWGQFTFTEALPFCFSSTQR